MFYKNWKKSNILSTTQIPFLINKEKLLFVGLLTAICEYVWSIMFWGALNHFWLKRFHVKNICKVFPVKVQTFFIHRKLQTSIHPSNVTLIKKTFLSLCQKKNIFSVASNLYRKTCKKDYFSLNGKNITNPQKADHDQN